MSRLDKLLSGSERLFLEGVIVAVDRTKTRGLPFIWGKSMVRKTCYESVHECTVCKCDHLTDRKPVKGDGKHYMGPSLASMGVAKLLAKSRLGCPIRPRVALEPRCLQ